MQCNAGAALRMPSLPIPSGASHNLNLLACLLVNIPKAKEEVL
jgi:hypothetical protein